MTEPYVAKQVSGLYLFAGLQAAAHRPTPDESQSMGLSKVWEWELKNSPNPSDLPRERWHHMARIPSSLFSLQKPYPVDCALRCHTARIPALIHAISRPIYR